MDQQEGLLVIGAGQMRTGTMSMSHALPRLLGGPCYHMIEVIRDKSRKGNLWIKACDREGHLTKEEWDEIFHGYVATVDHPACLFYKQLMEIYPNAKVILTVRDPKAWAKSVIQTTLEPSFQSLIRQSPTKWLFKPIPEMFHKLHSYTMPGYLSYKEKELEEYFIKWNEEVIRHVPKERLLVFRVEEGWEPLCRFLNVPVPEGVPFPKTHDTKEFQGHITKFRRIHYFIRYSIGTLMIAALFGVGNWLYKNAVMKNVFIL